MAPTIMPRDHTHPVFEPAESKLPPLSGTGLKIPLKKPGFTIWCQHKHGNRNGKIPCTIDRFLLNFFDPGNISKHHHEFRRSESIEQFNRITLRPVMNLISLYTIGHGNRREAEFIHLLETFGIQLVLDIRRFPSSKKHPQFNQENLCRSLRAVGIEYQHLGEELGGYRTGGYREHMKSELFRSGIARVLELASRRTCCLLCAEVNYKGCHRRFVCDSLVEKGLVVNHIVNDTTTVSHEESLL